MRCPAICRGAGSPGAARRGTLAGATALLLATLWAAMGGTTGPSLRDADLAWEHGDYPAAIRGYLALLDSPERDQVLEPIALRTGELYGTLELTDDGGAARFSPDSRHFSYEVGRGIARRTRVSRTGAPADAAVELPGHGAAFSPDGSRIAYIKLEVTPAMLELEAAAATATRADLAALHELTASASRLAVHDISAGTERELDVPLRGITAVRPAAGTLLLFTAPDADGTLQVFQVDDGAAAALTSGTPDKRLQAVNATGTTAIFTERPRGGRSRFGVLSLTDRSVAMVTGSAPAFSADGDRLAYVDERPGHSQLLVAGTAAPALPTVVRSGTERLDAPAFSPDGSRLVFQIMPREDWELHVINRDGTGERRITREIQHDEAPQFLTRDRVLGLTGEPRHRRSYVHDLSAGTRTRLFHNNTIRTIAPEYHWAPSPDGTKLLIVAERDGDTVSPERGVYLVDLARTVTREELRARLERSLAGEEALRARGRQLFAPIADAVRQIVDQISIARVFTYQKALVAFDSKHISRPGNRLAATYLFDTYRSFGYEPEYQWFEHRAALDGQTANVLATLKGTRNPELVYVVSSHYDSVEDSPGADDNSSGTAALLETARVMARRPQPATIVFASFTGEESGLLGSREFVRRAMAGGVRIVGALNNDMVGWANDHRLDNTIRYSNPGIRDVQHGAAIQFSRLITYDARYYKNTDAHAYYEAYGDIVGGIGSYPVLGSPHYHQPHDVLDTINHQLVAEVAKTTAASLLLLASSPSRIGGLQADRHENGTAHLSWTPSPEKGVTGYIVAWGPPSAPEPRTIRVTTPAARVDAGPGTVISVKAVNQEGLEGWDWARIVVD